MIAAKLLSDMPKSRLYREIENLELALAAWKHWVNVEEMRDRHKGKSMLDKRLWCQAAELAEESHANAIEAAATLFEIDSGFLS